MRFGYHSWLGWASTFEAMMRKFCRLESRASSTGFKRAFPQILLALASVVWISTTLPCWGQATTGSIVGTITDATGAVVPRAAVSATNTSTGVASQTTADSSGHYSFLSLPAGSYTVSAEKTGFNITTLTGIS